MGALQSSIFQAIEADTMVLTEPIEQTKQGVVCVGELMTLLTLPSILSPTLVSLSELFEAVPVMCKRIHR